MMTIEEKALAYDEAFAAIKSKYEMAKRSKASGTIKWMEEIFPQLAKESKDERIRKFLLYQYKGFKSTDYYDDGITFGDVVAWLEKQKEQNSPEWSEVDESNMEDIIYAVKRQWNKDDDDEMIRLLKSLRNRYTWKPSEEQLKVLERLVSELGQGKSVTSSPKIRYSELSVLLEDLKKL